MRHDPSWVLAEDCAEELVSVFTVQSGEVPGAADNIDLLFDLGDSPLDEPERRLVAVFLDHLDGVALMGVLPRVDGDIGWDDAPDDGGGEEVGTGDMEEGFDVEEGTLLICVDAAGVEHVGGFDGTHGLTLLAQLRIVLACFLQLIGKLVSGFRLENVVETYLEWSHDQRTDPLLLECLQDLAELPVVL